MITLIINVGLPLLLLIVAYLFGAYNEKRHYQSIIEREKTTADILIIPTRYAPEGSEGGELVMGSVVIASDGFKRFLAGIIGFFGGNLGVYESLLDRARREAILRMKWQARLRDANMIINVKFETATLNSMQNNSSAMIEVLAYGTVVRHKP